MRTVFAVAAAFAMTIATPAFAQQGPDPDADVTVAFPHFTGRYGPMVRMDAGHRETQTSAPTSGYSTLAALLRNDGYGVENFNGPLTEEYLAGTSVLVIANPRNAQPSPTGSPLDSLSAFTPAEIAALYQWVWNGGSLLICADHPPFAGSVRDLAAAFGFTINRYGAYRPGWPNGNELFTSTNGGLEYNFMTVDLNQIQTFVGTGFTAPANAIPLLRFTPGWTFADKSDPNMTPIPATSDDLRGAAISIGQGRVVLLGETGQLAAQLTSQGQPMGWNAPDAYDNKQFALNIFYWLATGATPPVPIRDGGPAQPTP